VTHTKRQKMEDAIKPRREFLFSEVLYFDILLSVNGEDSYGGFAMICVLFSGFLGRVPCCAPRISTSVTCPQILR